MTQTLGNEYHIEE